LLPFRFVYSPAIKTFARASILPPLVATELERHSHHPAFHSTTVLPRDVHMPHMPGFPFVPFQRRHAHQTYTVPQSVMMLHLAGQRQAQHATRTRAAPGYKPRSRLLQASYFARRQKAASQNGMKPRIARRSSQILCDQKRTINPVCEYERLKAGQ
jgi:hypothetical protein